MATLQINARAATTAAAWAMIHAIAARFFVIKVYTDVSKMFVTMTMVDNGLTSPLRITLLQRDRHPATPAISAHNRASALDIQITVTWIILIAGHPI